MQWHVETEMFNLAHKTQFIIKKTLWVVGLSSAFFLVFSFSFLFFFFVVLMVFVVTLDLIWVQKRSSCHNFLVCHMNLNSINAHDLGKIDLQACNTIHQYDMICLLESYLDASVSSDDDDLNVNGYKLVRADHPWNVKRGVVCVCILRNRYLWDVYLILT